MTRYGSTILYHWKWILCDYYDQNRVSIVFKMMEMSLGNRVLVSMYEVPLIVAPIGHLPLSS